MKSILLVCLFVASLSVLGGCGSKEEKADPGGFTAQAKEFGTSATDISAKAKEALDKGEGIDLSENISKMGDLLADMEVNQQKLDETVKQAAADVMSLADELYETAQLLEGFLGDKNIPAATGILQQFSQALDGYNAAVSKYEKLIVY